MGAGELARRAAVGSGAADRRLGGGISRSARCRLRRAGRLLAELESRARRLGYERVRLTTGDGQAEALRLFQTAGYREIPPFTDGVFTRHWMEKRLG